MRHVIADIETDGLLDELTTIHSLVLRDLETDEVLSCTDSVPASAGFPSISSGLIELKKADRIYFHNGIKFDYPALRKVYPNFTLRRDQIRDTLVIAQMRWAHIKDSDFARAKAGQMPAKLAGSHSLEAWGYRLGVYKGEYTDWCKEHGISNPWAEWRPEMQTYCEGDTATTKALVLHIRKHGVSAESVDIEHDLAWYLAAQERAGVPFDRDKAIRLQGQWSARREELGQQLRQEFGSLVIRNGAPHTPKKDIKTRGVFAGCPYQKIKYVEFNPKSNAHIEAKLKALYGWKPLEFTDSGKAKLDEKTLKGLNADIPAVKLLLEYLLITKRLGQISEDKEGWLRHARENGPEGGKLTGLFHIHGRIKQNHAITHRASHASPNLSAVPKVGSPFGAECRELFYVPEGWVLVGADASGLEARNLGHYMARIDGGEYGKLLLEGDVHTANRIALGLPGEPVAAAKAARNGSKTFYYAFMYGGGDEKLGSILAGIQTPDQKPLLPVPKGGWTQGALKKLGGAKKDEFLNNTPALAALIASVKKAVKKQGYLILPDGRRAYVRSEHSALNTLLQGAGAILIKKWIANFSGILWDTLGEPGWRGSWCPLLWSHDEVQIAVLESKASYVQQVLVEEIRKVGEHYKWRVPLDGEAKAGPNWKATH